MTFLWPRMLLCLFIVPACVGAYIWLLRRQKKAMLRYASLSLVKDALGNATHKRRHLPPLLFLIALTLMIVAIARPAMVLTLPSRHDTIILALDVSGSMRAEDVRPNRLGAALSAIRGFIAAQPRTTHIGLVSFAANAAVVQAPTTNRENIEAALSRFSLQRGTAVGHGILISLKTIFPDLDVDMDSPNFRSPAAMEKEGDNPSGAITGGTSPQSQATTPGSYRSAAVILLSDGQSTTGPDPLDAARIAAQRGVRIFTVGIGTPEGEIIGVEGWSMRVSLDESTLKKIAEETRGEYFYASNATELKKVYKMVNSRLVLEPQETETTAFFAAAAAIFALLSAVFSMLWFNRVL